MALYLPRYKIAIVLEDDPHDMPADPEAFPGFMVVSATTTGAGASDTMRMDAQEGVRAPGKASPDRAARHREPRDRIAWSSDSEHS